MDASEQHLREGEQHPDPLDYRSPWTLRANRHPDAEVGQPGRPGGGGVLDTNEANRPG
ncbi:hypothetical protein IDM40_21800 [Nocardiopsis sp. HNM0947]|uniref:Uncharacterized protein n=1 Tax=Nocardiopsis coralli TaxID=2772213 RepID=A0ABR9PBU0_9ACTN|nr:hypothetical protein [Nocardiopsis coralli]MBE3001306.1 hypothetical protein [Nocardiopsis coralli]